LRVLILLIYGLFIFILTCTRDLRGLYIDLTPTFQWVAQPNYLVFFELQYPFHNPGYIVQKVGHIAAFFLLAAILYWAVKQLSVVFIVAVTYALFTEVAQLYFSRTGNLLDVGYDILGVLFFILICIGWRFMFIFERRIKKEA
jgi:VanZ family protein